MSKFGDAFKDVWEKNKGKIVDEGIKLFDAHVVPKMREYADKTPGKFDDLLIEASIGLVKGGLELLKGDEAAKV